MGVKPCVKFCIVLILWSFIFSVKWIAVVGVCVFLHECAHMAACRILGIPVLGVRPLPWGLTASAPMMYEPFSQFAVSVAGPMFNFFLLMFSGIVERMFGEETSGLFVLANLADGLLNLIPALPLDGGIILKAFLCSRLGFIRGFIRMIHLTAGIGVFLMIFGVQMFLATGYNVSYFVAGLFVVINLRHEKEILWCVKKRVLTGEIRSVPLKKGMSVSFESNALRLVDFISPSYTLVFKVMKDKKEIGILHQDRLLECVLKNAMITAGECIEKI